MKIRPVDFAAALLISLAPALALADGTQIQMLPPIEESGAGNIVCSGGLGSRILTWDGSTAIKCAANITASGGNLFANGNVTAGSVNSNGAMTAAGNIVTTGGNILATAGNVSAASVTSAGAITSTGGDIQATSGNLRASNGVIAGGNVTAGGSLIGTNAVLGGTTIDGNDAQTLNSLKNIPNCVVNQALTKTSATSFSCINVSDITNIGTATVPTCSVGQALTFTNGTFACETIQQQPAGASTPPVCTGNNALQYDGTNWNCIPVATSTPQTGDVLYVKNATFTNYNVYNNAIATEAAVMPPSVAEGLMQNCPITSDSDATGLNRAVNSIACMTAACYGYYTQPPLITYVTGTCVPGQGNPACDNASPQHMVLSISCLTTQ